MKKNLIFFLCLCFSFGIAQNRDASGLIAQVETEAKTESGYKAASVDLKTAKDDDLLIAAHNASSESKVAIANELVERKSSKVEHLFKDFLTDNQIFTQTLGAISYETTAAAELFASVARQKEKAERKKYYEKTNSKKVQSELKGLFGRDYSTKWTIAECDVFLPKLTSMALAKDDVHPRTLNQIFQTLNYKSKSYDRVKYFAKKHATPELLATLARFKNPSDVAFLQSQNEKSYLAISYFPDATFFANLKQADAANYTNGDFQTAVCAFKSLESKALLDKMCDGIFASTKNKTQRDDSLFSLYSLIEKQNSKLYAPVLKKIDALMAKP